MDDSPPLILASTSPYRRELLSRLRVPFEVIRPQVPEDYCADEKPPDRALRLALEKADAVAKQFPNSVVIGSDQVAACADAILDKPGDTANAFAQLKALSGNAASFHTACAVISVTRSTRLSTVVTTSAVFRHLSDEEIKRYIASEPAFDCAGGAKAEGLGISLVKKIESDDPTALIGLPLIWVADALRRAGYHIP